VFGDIIQPTHLLFILVVALIVLGPKRLPEVGRSLGRGIRDFRQGMQGVEEEARGVFRDAIDEPPADSGVSTVPEPLSPATMEAPESVAELGRRMGLAPTGAAPAAAPVVPRPAPAATRVAAEPDPSDYAD
jgi:sec-independent protein translocase protein TatA